MEKRYEVRVFHSEGESLHKTLAFCGLGLARFFAEEWRKTGFFVRIFDLRYGEEIAS